MAVPWAGIIGAAIGGTNAILLTPERQREERNKRDLAAKLALTGNTAMALQQTPHDPSPWKAVISGSAQGFSSGMGMGQGMGGGGGGEAEAAKPQMEGVGWNDPNPPYASQQKPLSFMPEHERLFNFNADQAKYYGDVPRSTPTAYDLMPGSPGSGDRPVMERGPSAAYFAKPEYQRLFEEAQAKYYPPENPQASKAQQSQQAQQLARAERQKKMNPWYQLQQGGYA